MRSRAGSTKSKIVKLVSSLEVGESKRVILTEIADTFVCVRVSAMRAGKELGIKLSTHEDKPNERVTITRVS